MRSAVRSLFCLVLCAALALSAFAVPVGADAVLGDVDGSGNISASDFLLAMKYALGEEACAPGTDAFTACDVTCDGRLTAADARAIYRVAVKKDEFLTPQSTEAVFAYDAPQEPVPEARIALRVLDRVNDRVTLAVMLEHCAGLTSADFTIAYDPACLSSKKVPHEGTDLNRFLRGVEIDAVKFRFNTADDRGTIRVSFFAEEPLPDENGLNAVWDETAREIKPNMDEFELLTVELYVHDCDPADLSGTVQIKTAESGGIELAAQTETELVTVHNHKWYYSGRTEPTCADGAIYRKCSICGEVEVTRLPAVKEHHWDAVAGGPATADAEGDILWECTVCGEEKEELYTKLTDPAGGNVLYARRIGYVLAVAPDRAFAGALECLAAPGCPLLDDQDRPIPSTQALTPGQLVMTEEYSYYIAILGDADADGHVTAADARYALRVSVKLEVPDKMQLAACRTTDKNVVTAADARAILRAAVKLDGMRFV